MSPHGAYTSYTKDECQKYQKRKKFQSDSRLSQNTASAIHIHLQ